ncbi:PucR family transcriptional regulator [Nesterenkonia muleiensis]|uniref:PucR family transcriptional regulator n=1 Tax=Nesterenkonia muleiensis TaxID=2282648 RepID=UPI000E76B5F8|nr:helix-turn-helix domain-containing protein [Nesterenkonia muleiensis]
MAEFTYDEAIQTEVDALAQRLRRSVLVNDPMVRNLYRSAHFGDEDPLRIRALLQRDTGTDVVSYIFAHGVPSWTGPGRIPPNPELGMIHPRVCTPIRRPGRPGEDMIGMIMLVDPGDSLTPEDLDLIRRSSQLLAPLMEARLYPAAGEAQHDQALWDLLSDDPARRQQGLADLAPQPLTHLMVTRMAVDDPQPSELRQAQVRVALHDVARPRHMSPQSPVTQMLSAVAEDTAVLLLGCRDAVESPAHTGEWASEEISRIRRMFIEAAPEGASLRIGCGSTVRGVEHAYASARQAGAALKAAQQGLTAEPVTFWSKLGPMGVLLGLPRTHLSRSLLPDEMQRLLKAVPFDELIRTLRVYLDHGGNGPASAEALHIHRTTLYYRLGRISDLAGLDLSDGRTRLSLHLGLTMLPMLLEDER